MKGLRADDTVMRPPLRRIGVILLVLNVEIAGEFLGLAGVARTALRDGPTWLSAVLAFLMQKSVLAITAFVLGMIMADWIIRYDERVRGRYGSVPTSWLVVNIILTQASVRHPMTLGRLIDRRRALTRANALLTRADFRFPPLPTTDPSDSAGMLGTRRYLDVVGWLILTDRDEARVRAKAMVRTFRR